MRPEHGVLQSSMIVLARSELRRNSATRKISMTRLVAAAFRGGRLEVSGGEQSWAAATPTSKKSNTQPATQKYKVTFLPSGKTVEVDPEKIPYGHNGIPGSILDISEGFKDGPGSRVWREFAPAPPAT